MDREGGAAFVKRLDHSALEYDRWKPVKGTMHVGAGVLGGVDNKVLQWGAQVTYTT